MKTLDKWEEEMSRLYDEVRGGTTELKTASELSNICGKALKAQQLQLAREIFHAQKAKPLTLDAPDQPALTLVEGASAAH